MTEGLPKRICKNDQCRIEFDPKTPKQIYHDRKCFMDEWKRKRRSTGRPKFRCPECDKVSQLEFSPKSTLAFYRWSCECGYRPL